ncbi:hypothetical protein B0A49_00818 [Cryomyces minteri]|uniref:Uncharacterized protein n=1 Tax=Cryomyces minteri TaxID=331657 RepID=A0A4U0XQS9_9PEZI|nr:hypothetical protein B0A49_00818 [Cryomyces minteri]
MPRQARRSSYQQEEAQISILSMDRNRELMEDTPDLNKRPAESLAVRLQDISRLAESALIVVVQGCAPWLGTALERAIPGYRAEISNRMYEENGPIQQPSSPYAGGRARVHLTSIMEYMGNSVGATGDQSVSLSALRTRVGIWVGPETQLAEELQPRPVIVLFFLKNTKRWFAREIANRLWISPANCFHFLRLKMDPLYIFVSLYRAFTNWSFISDRLSGMYHEAERNSEQRSLLVINRVRLLHRSVGKILALREILRSHIVAAARIQKYARTEVGEGRRDVKSQLADIEDETKDYELAFATIQKQFENLLSLEFSTENVRTSQSVAVITALAFVFVPLSFSASVFGLNGVNVDAKWFGIACIPIVVVSLICTLSIGGIIRLWERNQSEQKELGLDEPPDVLPIVRYNVLTRQRNTRPSGREHA